MRVISGKYKGKKLCGFDINGTRPTMDRVKESIFGIIQNDIRDNICLDLFAGSGSLGIEALSNGAKKCVFVEKNKEMVQILNNNLVLIDNFSILHSDYMDALKLFIKKNEKFDVIFLDPPYKLNLINNILDIIIENKLLNYGGIVVCEYENEIVQNNKLELIKEKKYGSKRVNIYKYV
ncbi:MAG: 16S rRNA (guanine(966)-N(2))-methyltransferase RsmD [Bacilli bacterium]|nr:16S rRNA (guanine(966)-N(2))-methyltransferase RsmD [Bacilli bacterium]